MTGTNHSRPTRLQESRSERLRRRREAQRSFALQRPTVDNHSELWSLGAFTALLLVNAIILAGAVFSGYAGPDSDLRAVLAFALGLIAACAVASAMTSLIRIRNWLLLVALALAAVAVVSELSGIGQLESIAKILFGAAAGLWISLLIGSVGQLALIAVLIVIVDFYSVFLGPTRKLVEGDSPWLERLTISLPTVAVDAESLLGIADIIFFSLFIGCALHFRLRRVASAIAMTLSLVLTMMVGVTLEMGVPALPLISFSFLIVNADLLYRRFLAEPDAATPGSHAHGKHEPGE